ncbi:hypothetical protein PGT21_035341 [Puccinia graminis f. sp. tritici]|uniref:Uncharacterized protein n=1 Tax=Puccinia graminis f. sp. tritici TaxID=56615 RepID=A0A5B0M8Y2_PUCGR|nr:hypothetical protein PGTUg99_025131 [Puccinia graminis f. sp. tritici]KAA1084782.1 hypothetical protein PGT21_035341 [Puccinia graminis f. sp. tritici]
MHNISFPELPPSSLPIALEDAFALAIFGYIIFYIIRKICTCQSSQSTNTNIEKAATFRLSHLTKTDPDMAIIVLVALGIYAVN